jgi:hypothetical protein
MNKEIFIKLICCMTIQNNLFKLEYNLKKRTKDYLLNYYVYRWNSSIYIFLKKIFLIRSFYFPRFFKKKRGKNKFDIKIYWSSSQDIEINIKDKIVNYNFKRNINNILKLQTIWYKYWLCPDIIWHNLKERQITVSFFKWKVLWYRNIDYKIIVAVFKKMFLFYDEHIIKIKTETYINNLYKNINKKSIKHFWKKIIDKFKIDLNLNIFIANTHWDIWLNNIIIWNNNIFKLIDWEFAGERSITYDYVFLYYLFLTGEKTDWQIFIDKTKDILNSFEKLYWIDITKKIDDLIKITILERILMELKSIDDFKMTKTTIYNRINFLNTFLKNRWQL